MSLGIQYENLSQKNEINPNKQKDPRVLRCKGKTCAQENAGNGVGCSLSRCTNLFVKMPVTRLLRI